MNSEDIQVAEKPLDEPPRLISAFAVAWQVRDLCHASVPRAPTSGDSFSSLPIGSSLMPPSPPVPIEGLIPPRIST